MIEALNGINISGYTAYEKENEIILPIGTKLKVKSDPLEQPNNSFLVHLIEIEDEHDQQEHLPSETNHLHVKTTQKEKSKSKLL